MTETTTPRGASLYFDEARQFLMVEGVIARGIPTFPLAARPKRNARAAAFDGLGGNTTLGIHLSEITPGGEKPGHRHLDEATFYIISGHGHSELRQGDGPDQEIDWQAGDIVTIPANAWHHHYNGSQDEPALQIAFKNTRLLRKLFHSREFVYQNDFRFHDRYDDEPDYWTRSEAGNHGKVRTNYIPDVVAQAVEPDPEAGDRVGIRRYSMGGHRTLDHALVEIGVGGRVRRHRHLAEEAFLVLQGRGRTVIADDEGHEVTIDWQAGDLLAPPFRTWREHHQVGGEPVRYWQVKNNFIERALGIKGNLSLDSELPVRFPDVIEADRSVFDRAGRGEGGPG